MSNITEQLKRLKNHLSKVANEYGSFSLDLEVTVYGQAVCFNCKATSIQNSELVYKVAGTEESIEQNLRKELNNHDADLFRRRALDRWFPSVDDLNEISIIK